MLACGIFGGSYTSAWVGISYTVVLTGMLIASAMFAIASFMPGETRSRFQEMAKAELVQLIISAFIIAVLMAFSATICNVVATESQQLTGTSMQPFQYAEYFIGNLSQNTGLRLLSYIYTASMTYSITAKVFQILPIYSIPYTTLSKTIGSTSLEITPKAGVSLATPYAAMSSVYMDLFSPLLTISIGMLFIMYLLLPIIQYAAFAIVLPVALILRSIAYTGGGSGLRTAANSILAIAIAFYFIYPLTIALDHYMVNQIFTPANPEYAFLHQKVDLNTIPQSFFSSSSYTTNTNSLLPISPYSSTLQLPSIYTMFQYMISMGIFQGYSFLFTVPSEVQYVITMLGQFIFIAIFLFAIDLTITIAFAMSLFKALESGFGTK